jgi:uncharacterized membrane protein YkvA (DUF1232 family)
MMTAATFEELIGEGIVRLPQDLKSMMRIVEDPDLDDDGRALAAGAVLHVLSGHNAIPGMRGVLAYVDDVIVLRLALERLVKRAPDVMDEHRDHDPELLEDLEADMGLVRGYLGELTTVLERAADGLVELTWHGHTAKECARDPDATTWLYETVLEALVDDLDFDEDEVQRKTRNLARIKTPLEQRMAVL